MFQNLPLTQAPKYEERATYTYTYTCTCTCTCTCT